MIGCVSTRIIYCNKWTIHPINWICKFLRIRKNLQREFSLKWLLMLRSNRQSDPSEFIQCICEPNLFLCLDFDFFKTLKCFVFDHQRGISCKIKRLVRLIKICKSFSYNPLTWIHWIYRGRDLFEPQLCKFSLIPIIRHPAVLYNHNMWTQRQ